VQVLAHSASARGPGPGRARRARSASCRSERDPVQAGAAPSLIMLAQSVRALSMKSGFSRPRRYGRSIRSLPGRREIRALDVEEHARTSLGVLESRPIEDRVDVARLVTVQWKSAVSKFRPSVVGESWPTGTSRGALVPSRRSSPRELDLENFKPVGGGTQSRKQDGLGRSSVRRAGQSRREIRVLAAGRGARPGADCWRGRTDRFGR